MSGSGQTRRPFLASLGRNVALQIALGVIGCCLAVICLFALLSALSLVEDSDSVMILLLVGLVCFTIVMFVGVPVGAVLVILSRGRRWDEVFAPLGLTGSMYALTGRQYRGIVSGRQVTAQIYRGPTLNLTAQTSLRTQMAIGTRTGLGTTLGRLIGAQPLQLDDPDFEHLVASAREENWARTLLADSKARELILRLTTYEGPYEVRNLIIREGTLRLSLFRFRLSSLTFENVQTWINDLLRLADAAEDLEAPSEP